MQNTMYFFPIWDSVKNNRKNEKKGKIFEWEFSVLNKHD